MKICYSYCIFISQFLKGTGTVLFSRNGHNSGFFIFLMLSTFIKSTVNHKFTEVIPLVFLHYFPPISGVFLTYDILNAVLWLRNIHLVGEICKNIFYGGLFLCVVIVIRNFKITNTQNWFYFMNICRFLTMLIFGMIFENKKKCNNRKYLWHFCSVSLNICGTTKTGII